MPVTSIENNQAKPSMRSEAFSPSSAAIRRSAHHRSSGDRGIEEAGDGESQGPL